MATAIEVEEMEVGEEASMRSMTLLSSSCCVATASFAARSRRLWGM
jgi:hypothetical protein